MASLADQAIDSECTGRAELNSSELVAVFQPSDHLQLGGKPRQSSVETSREDPAAAESDDVLVENPEDGLRVRDYNRLKLQRGGDEAKSPLELGQCAREVLVKVLVEHQERGVHRGVSAHGSSDGEENLEGSALTGEQGAGNQVGDAEESVELKDR